MPKTGFNLDLEARPEILSEIGQAVWDGIHGAVARLQPLRPRMEEVIVAVANVCGVLAEEWAKHGVPLSVLPDAIRQVVETKGGKFN